MSSDGTSLRAGPHIAIDSEWFRLKQGTLTNDQKVAELFERLRPSVYRYLVVLTGNPPEAEEVTQEAFLRLCQCLQEGQAIAHPRTWVFRVAHNLAIDQRLSRKYLAPLQPSSWDELCQFRPDPHPNPEQSILLQEHFQRLQTALRKLSGIQRECLTLRADGFKYEQIAEILGVSVANVAQSLRRGIRRLMEETHA
ncbi:MAG: RNA polymerase sigma factor [Acidimicrobiia bacterium]|nr:RNA polymerase sigma factor [Acidimicrobiia bacterium]